MKDMRIQVNPFEMLSVLEYTGCQEVNEHGTVFISGIIESEKKETYLRKAAQETWVQVYAYDEEDRENILFYGRLTNFKIREEGGGCVIELLLYTGTKRLDYETHIRTFQRGGYSYQEITEQINSKYQDADIIMTVGKGSSIPGFMMQYEETDWQFLKRLASTLNTVLVPDCGVEGEKYYFGIPDRRASAELEAEHYTVCQEYGLSAKGSPGNTMCYVVESRSILTLGSYTMFQGNKLWIWKIDTAWKGDELYHKYYLKSKDGFQVPRQYHDTIIGLSLLGTVKAAEGERVQIAITSDENQESGQCWFDFSTIYSSPDGAGWYCMPEVGDTIRLYCPSENESNAYVTSAVHENKGNGIRTNPAHKIWRNPQGKEIRMTPEKILLSNNNGMSVELIDGQGIKISSNGSIAIKASDNISISSNASLEMAAANKIVLKQGDTVMELSDGIKLSGSNINLQ